MLIIWHTIGKQTAGVEVTGTNFSKSDIMVELNKFFREEDIAGYSSSEIAKAVKVKGSYHKDGLSVRLA